MYARRRSRHLVANEELNSGLGRRQCATDRILPSLAAEVAERLAGGFLLSSRSVCVPPVFRVGKRSETVRFGLGRHCA